MIRKIAAVVFGAILAIVLIILVEGFSHVVYPPPADLDITDKEALRTYMHAAPVGALLMVCAAWMAGVFGGGLLATWISRDSALVNCAIIGGLVLVGTVLNLLSIPHPAWFAIVSVLAVIATTFATSRLASRFVVSGPDNMVETNSG